MSAHYGFCNTCNAISPASYEERQGRVLLVKQCPACGRTETVVSTDPEVWRVKRRLARVTEDSGCAVNCLSCGLTHAPTTVFIDVTNRCNMVCPICIANVAGMRFKFEPPFEYFRQLITQMAAWDPKPSIKLFGGEPTVREDLFDIINLARGLGISVSVVTNGIRLADEEYCRQLVRTRAKLILSFDGRDPEVYRTLRNDAACYEKKLQAIENIRRYHKNRVTLMCVVGKGLNDHLIADLLQYCHERSDIINALEFIPLARTWPAGSIEADGSEITAMEDVEKIVADALPGGRLEFLPAGLTPYRNLARYLALPRLTFAGAHPNCESISFLVSDGTQYRAMSDFVKGRSLLKVVEDLVACDERFGRRMDRLRRGPIGWLGLEKPVGRLLALGSIGRLAWRSADTRALLGPNRLWKALRIGAGLAFGGIPKEVLRANTRVHRGLRVVVLPFEEPRTLDSAKLKRCPAAFAYLDPADGKAKTMPVCSWGLFKDDMMRNIMAKSRDTQSVERNTERANAT